MEFQRRASKQAYDSQSPEILDGVSFADFVWLVVRVWEKEGGGGRERWVY